jgi:PAS domain S-box-containing protein
MMRSEIRITLIYAIIGILWIYFSDRAVELFFGTEPSLLTLVQTNKGILYVLITSALLFLLLHFELQQRRKQETKFHLLFAENPNPMWVYEPHTLAFLEVNDAAIETYGYSREAFLSMTIRDIRPVEDVAAVEDSITNRQSIKDFGEWRHKTKHGKLLHVEITSQQLDYDGREGVLVVARDVTERKQLQNERQLNERLQRELAQEQDAHNTRSRFFSMISHEFRTPLSTIISSIGLLQHYESRLSLEKRMAYYEKVLRQARILSEQLDEMLLLLRTDLAASNYQPQPDDIVTLCYDVIDTLATGHPSRSIQLDSTHESLRIDMDRKLIWRVLANLISNALKYSPDDKPVVVSLDVQNDTVEIRVADKGIGIPSHEQAQLFEPFFRASNATEKPGTGLGLTIVKQAIELHGGSIRVESTANVGTTFFVTLPLLQPFVVEEE